MVGHPTLQTEGLKSLVAEMKFLIAEQELCSIGNVHSCVLALKGQVAEVKGTVAGLEETIDNMAVDHASQVA